MIRILPFNNILPVLFALFFVVPSVQSQCPFTFVTYGDMAAAPAPGQTVITSNCHFVGEYATITGVVAGDIYNISYNGGVGTYLTIYDASFTPVAWGNSPIVGFTPTVSGDYYIISFDGPCTDFDPSFSCNEGTWSNVTPLPPPPNDLPCAAIALTPNINCNYTTYTNEFATAAPGVPAPGCAGYTGGDVWFSVVVPASGSVMIDTQVGVILDGGMAVYTGTCSSLTLVECDDDDSPNGAMPSILINQPPGTTVFIRVWEVGNNNPGTFGICAQEIALCGTPITNDYCESPAQLTQGPGNFSSTTSAIYSPDMPPTVTPAFCGSIENNSWYQFTALSTTEVFNFVNVSNCVLGFGIQATVYQVTNDLNGCCSTLTQVSNCFSPGTASLGTVTATSLTIGNSYVLMVDGFQGDDCDFSVANWLATGILPVELSNFYGVALSDYNAIRWETVSEVDNDYFYINRSYDGINFESIAKVDGVGYSQELNYYQYNDKDIRSGKVYYQLDQVDFDGHHELSEIIALDRKSTQGGLITAYPNPTTGKIITEVNGVNGSTGTIYVIDMNGTIILEKTVYSTGIEKHQLDISNYAAGLYFVRYSDGKSDQMVKLIKQ